MKNENPFFSIIMPVYNAEKYVEQSIKSVLNQTFTNFELIIIDDCSKDNSYREHGYREKPIKHRVRRNQINKSSENIQFETNEFLDDYKK